MLWTDGIYCYGLFLAFQPHIYKESANGRKRAGVRHITGGGGGESARSYTAANLLRIVSRGAKGENEVLCLVQVYVLADCRRYQSLGAPRPREPLLNPSLMNPERLGSEWCDDHAALVFY